MARTRTTAGSSAPAEPREPGGDALGRAALAAALAVVALLQIHRLDDPDTWWHLASGRQIWTTGAVPHVDPFSWTAAGAPWINRQWLFELALYASWLAGGPAGASLFAGAGFFAAFALVARILRRRMPAWAAAIVVALGGLAAVERFTVRPESVTLPMLAAVLILLDGEVTWTVVAAIVALQLVWANSHALSVLGIVAIGVAAASALAAERLPLPAAWRAAAARRPGEWIRIAAALVGALVAEAATPFGIEGAVFPLRLLADISGGRLVSFTIVEHRATSLAELSPVGAAALVALVALGATSLVASWRRLRLDHALTAIAFAYLATLARRNVALVGIGTAPLVASGLGPLARRADDWLARRRLRAPLAATLAVAGLVVCGRIVTGAFYEDAHLTRAFGLGESRLLYPARAVDFLVAHAPGARLLNDDLLGGYLIWRGEKVFFDGRIQFYPESVYLDWQRVLDDPATFPDVAARWRISAVLLHHPSPGRLELAGAIARVPGWRLAYLDGGGAVLLADGGGTQPPEGATGPVEAFATPGIAAVVEAVVAPVRRQTELSSTYYQRGRALHYLFGPPAFPLARADFEAALRLVPDDPSAIRGLQATASSR
jgi:hypothetical protein